LQLSVLDWLNFLAILLNMSFYIGCGAVLVQGERYVLIQEVRNAKKGLYNLPAGTLEVNESLQECLVREIKEETGVDMVPEHFVGLYQTVLASGDNILFFVFAANIPADASFASDEHTHIQAYTYDEIVALGDAGLLRAPSVLKSITDYRAGQRFPLAMIQTHVLDRLPAITVDKDH